MAALREIPELAGSISSALRKAGISHAVSGAAAMAAHGFVRATKDLDLLVLAPSVRLPEVFDIVRAHGFQGEDEELIASLHDRFFAELVSGPVRIDILVPAIPYHKIVLDRAVDLELAGTRVPVVALEDLVILKLLWRRAKDVPDIQALLAMAGTGFDADYARATFASILPEDDPRHAELAGLVERFCH